MCGICGFIGSRRIDLEGLKKMNDTLYHRGPDDGGEELFSLGGGVSLGLAQRRLSILDLSPLGHQPMHSQDGRILLVYNGEIYNFREIKEELKDYPFLSSCDTEVIIAAYLKWGISCVDRFNGMFAFALYDRKEEILYLVRDRMGKKPLYYWMDGENLVFASELKPIMETPGFLAKINHSILSRFLFQQYINGPDSIYEGVYKLNPGSILSWQKGRIKIWKYWDVYETYEKMQIKPVKDYAEAKDGLKERLKKAVARRMISDVPLGAFLSGGYDSSLMTALAQEASGKPVKTFSIGFHEERYNEARYAAQVAHYLGTNHTELYISEKEMFDQVDSIPRFYDEPFADSSQIPSMLVAGLAKKQVTVALSGDGGDEFFCGYNVYEDVALAQKLDVLGGMVYGVCNLPGVRRLSLLDSLPLKVRVIAANRNPENKTQFDSTSYLKLAREMVMGAGEECRYEIESRYPVKNWQIRRMLVDMDTYLPGDILCKVDRATMKYSLEARCPILDKEVMEYSFALPHEFKYKEGVKKRILKDIAYDYIPRSLLDRPKVGFSVPLDKWLRGPLREQLLDYSRRDFLVRQGIFDGDCVSGLVNRYLQTGDAGPGTGANFSKICWSFFAFQQWYNYYHREGK
ncbi:MAG: asparagine synthase (glutamine-hydrolyzing) [Lachnospiraceae bacterium]|nr:asparagine synthase (glutamine-hydrolyzing) [Lachnospiraceae bacterium]